MSITAAIVPNHHLRRSSSALIRQLENDPSAYVRGCAALDLGHAREKRAAPSLIKTLHDPSIWVRGWSAFALGQLLDPSAIPALCRTLGDDDPWVQQQVTDALLRFDTSLTHDLLLGTVKRGDPVAKSWAIHALAQGDRPQTALDLLPNLESDQRLVRLTTLRALYKLRNPVTIPPVRMFMHDPDENLRGAAAFALGWLEDRHSVPALVRALADRSPWVRRNAAWSLFQLGEELPRLAAMTRDRDPGVANLARNARQRLHSSPHLSA